MIQLLEQGYAVKLMDLGVLKIKHKGKLQKASDAENSSNFTIGFTPSEITLNSVKELTVDSVLQTDNSPTIEKITDVFRNETDGFITANQVVKLSGTKLKIGNKSGKIYFVPQIEVSDEFQNSEKSAWIEVPYSKIFRDMPSELIFFAPENLTSETKYKIRIETSYLSSTNSRANALTCESEVVSVA